MRLWNYSVGNYHPFMVPLSPLPQRWFLLPRRSGELQTRIVSSSDPGFIFLIYPSSVLICRNKRLVILIKIYWLISFLSSPLKSHSHGKNRIGVDPLLRAWATV